jgi:DNA replication and repair protein RecF
MDIQRGVTTIGPHRDDMRIFSNEIDLSDYGSRGQIRTALLALKMAEVEWMRSKTGQNPVLLLDEVLAELDPQRRSDLLQYLSKYEQAFLTTTDLHLFSPSFTQQCSVWNIEAGKISPSV